MNRIALAIVLAVISVLLSPSQARAADQRCPFSANGTLAAGSSLQSGRLRNGLASACGTQKTAPSIVSPTATFRFDRYVFQNRSRSSACVTIMLTATAGTVESAAYVGTFDEANPQAGYLGDGGANANADTISYSVTVPALSTFTVTVNATSTTTAKYTLGVTGCGAIVVTQVTPNAGPNGGGTAITIAGSGFLAGPTVKIGGVAATNVALVDDATIRATTPAGTAGAADVIVTNADATTSTLPAGFDYVAVKASTVTLTSATNPSVFGQSLTLDVAVTNSNGTPAGTVMFLDGATSLGSATLDASGKASFSTSALAAGSHSLTAQYAGSGVEGPGTSAKLVQVVSPGPTATTLMTSANPIDISGSATITASVIPIAPASGIPGGNVDFAIDGTSVGTVALDAAGKAQKTASGLTQGNHTIVATYAGAGNYATSVSSPLVQSVALPVTTISLSSSPNPSVLGGKVTLSVVVMPQTGSAVPTGKVTFADDGIALGTATLDASGAATFVTDALTLGAHPIVATYEADPTHASSASMSVSQVVGIGFDAGPLPEGGTTSADAGDAGIGVDGGLVTPLVDASFDASIDDTILVEDDPGGCDCRSGTRAPGSSAAIALGVALLLARSRRRAAPERRDEGSEAPTRPKS